MDMKGDQRPAGELLKGNEMECTDLAAGQVGEPLMDSRARRRLLRIMCEQPRQCLVEPRLAFNSLGGWE